MAETPVVETPVSEVIAETPAPEQSETASPATEAAAPEQTPEPVKSFTQEELDAAISKRLARESRKWEREQAKRIAEAVASVAPKPAAELKADQFATPEEYADALANQKADRIIAERDAQRNQTETLISHAEREEAAVEKYEDYIQVTRNPALPITPGMAQVIQASESGPDIAYYLGTNPKEAARISHLAPFLQAKEIGRIEAKLAADPPAPKKTSSAPAPINPVTPKSGTPVSDPTDPRFIKQHGTSAWIEADRARQRKALEARGNR